MISSRPLLRASLRPATRSAKPIRLNNVRFQSNAPSGSAATGLATTGLAAGAVGGLVAYGIWYFTPSGQMSRQLNKTAYDAHSYYKEATKTLQAKTPNTDEAIHALRSYATSYASWVPGGQGMVDSAFDELEKIRQDHGQEVDDIVRDTYTELQDASKSGLSVETGRKMIDAFNRLQKRLVGLAGGNLSEILDRHPMLQNTIGKPIEQLKQMGDKMGPQVKEEVDKTWDQLKEVMQGGLSSANLAKAREIVQEKTEKLRKMGDDLWKQGAEQAKPLLDKNPKVKKLLEDNESALKQGNMRELLQKLTSAAKSGDTGDLEGYIKDSTQKAKKTASSMTGGGGGLGGFEEYAKMIPGGDQIVPMLSQLKEVATSHRDEGEHLLKETMDEIRKVMDKQSDKARQLLEKSK